MESDKTVTLPQTVSFSTTQHKVQQKGEDHADEDHRDHREMKGHSFALIVDVPGQLSKP